MLQRLMEHHFFTNFNLILMEIMDNLQETKDPKSVSPYPTALRFGFIGGLCFIVYGLILYMFFSNPAEAGIMGSVYQMGVSTVLFTTIIVMAIKKHRDEDLGGYISFGRAFWTGFVTIIITRAIFALFSLLYTTVIHPDYAKEMQENLRTLYERQGMSEQQIEQSLGFVQMFSNPLIGFGFLLVWAAISGAIVGAIVAAIMQKEKPASSL